MDVSGYDITPSHSPALDSYVHEQVGQSNAGLGQQYTSGDAPARGLLNQPSNFNSGLSYGDQATSQAIRTRYSQPYLRQEHELNTKTMVNADQDHVKRLQVASQMANEEVAMNNQKMLLKYQIDQANKRARGAVLGSVLGIVGGVGGGVAGAGTGVGAIGGAGAGMALGEGVGQMSGSM